MPDMLAIAQGFNAVKALTDIAKTMMGLRDSAKLLEANVEFNQQLLAIQKALLDAHTEQTTLIQTVRQHEEEIARLEAWEAEKQRYELERLPPGIFIYSLKPVMASGEPMHSICQTCYQRGKKRILSLDEPFGGVQKIH